MYQKNINLNNAPLSTKVGFFALIFAFFIFVNHSMKNEAYDYSLDQIKNNDEVLLYLGGSIEAGFIVTGETGSIETELEYSIQGTLNSADVYLYAIVKNGYWVIEELIVTVDGVNKVIDATPIQ
jgi:hypothetical protein